ncbi:MAG: restriction endonuclease [Cenarchaeum sp. SB0661_bin_35]|nr:restriction endonuclease [Cenarchaeum sp. SB0667_bin_13]MXZ93777.1 restriction endonuclease [Cenarchaeum sp. SB0666_bin_15]MYB47294.1 restriction endonuclease [Cenarchaeum sp. SB0662_bin_33]MYC80295.1 restriction endonuclease [Cenarchaeum sp. SB0661_bin_35]MYI52229.1 restriction endonuclease [Cenarchaeum sp. SB0673_bin_9]MYJ27522.1 restriction endonuclease [Cenarchaeum sp. SB0672_bin_9]
MADETVHLNTLDGFAFEGLCARIFEKAGWGDITRLGGVSDRGRDLIINTPDCRKIIVECKFYSKKTTVGRPVVQKLHSAIIDSEADSGIVITTGKFSKSALEYAEDLKNRDHPIELYDMYKIMELAHEAGIDLETTDAAKIFLYPLLDAPTTSRTIHESMDEILYSHPRSVSKITQNIHTDVRLGANYYVLVSIQQTFSTAAGIIHQIDVENQPFLIDGCTGKLVDDVIVNFFGSPSITGDLPAGAPRTDFNINRTELQEHVKAEMQNLYARHVTYKGRNNSTYEKECTPTARNIEINSTRQVYLPFYFISLRVLNKEYSCEMLYNGRIAQVTRPTWDVCGLCDSDEKLILCNECGTVAHTSRFGSHGFECRKCQKTICHQCVWSARRLLVLSSRFCSDCRPANAKQKR